MNFCNKTKLEIDDIQNSLITISQQTLQDELNELLKKSDAIKVSSNLSNLNGSNQNSHFIEILANEQKYPPKIV